LTNVRPPAPQHSVRVGYVVKDGPQGSIFVDPDIGTHLEYLHDVTISSPSAGQVLTRNSGNTAWINQQATPAGVISQFAGASAPSGYFMCQGQQIQIAAYPTLYSVLTSGGTVFPYGANTNGSGGAGSTHFRLPDLRTRVPAGKNDSGTFQTLGATGGTESRQLEVANLPSHTHSFSATTSSDGQHTHTYSGTTSTDGAHAHNIAIGGTVLAYGNGTSGFGSGLGVMFGGNNGFVAASAGSHNHSFSGTTSGVSTNHTHTVSGTTGGGSGTGNSFQVLQPYIVLNYIIKF
jgi:microcystin-dependent protein